jgi:hypothetical protein
MDCFMTCEATEPLRTNSERLGEAWMLQFPGSRGSVASSDGTEETPQEPGIDRSDLLLVILHQYRVWIYL